MRTLITIAALCVAAIGGIDYSCESPRLAACPANQSVRITEPLLRRKIRTDTTPSIYPDAQGRRMANPGAGQRYYVQVTTCPNARYLSGAGQRGGILRWNVNLA
jgi:hypothetical protein